MMALSTCVWVRVWEWSSVYLLTVFMATVVTLAIRVTDVFEREQEEDHISFLILYRHYVQETPEWAC